MKNKRDKIKQIIGQHIKNNKKEYIIVALLFIIGIFLGVLFINHIQESQRSEINNYINQFIEKMKEIENIDYINLLKNSIGQNLLLAFTIWFFGTTVIGIPIVFGVVLYRGFCLGYTISACINIMGMSKGLSFVLINLLLPNIFLIPAILALAVSGFNLYHSIVKDNHKENIKLEIIRHTIFSIIMLVLLVISSFLEVFASTNILKMTVKYF